MKSFSWLEGTWTVTPELFSDLSWVKSTNDSLFLDFPLTDLSTRNWANAVKVNLETVVHWEWSQIFSLFLYPKRWLRRFVFLFLQHRLMIYGEQTIAISNQNRTIQTPRKRNKEEVCCARRIREKIEGDWSIWIGSYMARSQNYTYMLIT